MRRIAAVCVELLVISTIVFGAQQAQERGRVVNRDGAPLKGCRVEFFFPNQDPDKSKPALIAYSDDYGNFFLNGRPRGDYLVKVSLGGRWSYVKKVWIDDKGIHPLPFVIDW